MYRVDPDLYRISKHKKAKTKSKQSCPANVASEIQTLCLAESASLAHQNAEEDQETIVNAMACWMRQLEAIEAVSVVRKGQHQHVSMSTKARRNVDPVQKNTDF